MQRKSLVLGLIIAFAPVSAWAGLLAYPSAPAAEALSESVPTAFAPAGFTTSDFDVAWEGTAPTSVQAHLEPGSLEWVRVSEILVIPRGRLAVEGPADGSITCGGFTQALPAHIPVALISGHANACDVRIGQTTTKLAIHFHAAHVVAFDPSCSRFGVTAEDVGASTQADWMYVGCRMSSAMSGDTRTSNLEAYVFWDGVGESIDIGGVKTPESSASLWPLRLAAEASSVRLNGGSREVVLHYHVPKVLHRGGMAAGIGPYSYNYESTNFSEHTAAPILTLYGGLALNDSMRLVAFDATAFNTTLYTDFGAYLSTEYARIIDKRVLLSVMLGAHVIGFRSDGCYHLEPGAPQGLEATVTDAFARGAELRAGAFIYPNINGEEYYNAWLRWGRSSFFFELNYITWQENLDAKGLFYSRSLGVTVGMPLFQFL